ncbi:helix-turn-helix domain-containing protein [Halocynthiibacter namhaensis]|uniref:helix-turn-helix domain-containing protein n=1 Tax=Halocynthiibacter namhaensis TaxID=1290553 RepID=UPI00138DEDEF
MFPPDSWNAASKKKTNASPLPAYRSLRLEKALQLLQHTSMSLPEIAIATGFGTRCNLTRWFTRAYNCSPKAMRDEVFSGASPQGSA